MSKICSKAVQIYYCQSMSKGWIKIQNQVVIKWKVFEKKFFFYHKVGLILFLWLPNFFL